MGAVLAMYSHGTESGCFRLYEAKMVDFFNHRAATSSLAKRRSTERTSPVSDARELQDQRVLGFP